MKIKLQKAPRPATTAYLGLEPHYHHIQTIWAPMYRRRLWGHLP